MVGKNPGGDPSTDKVFSSLLQLAHSVRNIVDNVILYVQQMHVDDEGHSLKAPHGNSKGKKAAKEAGRAVSTSCSITIRPLMVTKGLCQVA